MRWHLPIVVLALVSACGGERPLGDGGTSSDSGTSTETLEAGDDGTSEEGSEPEDCGGFSLVPELIPSNLVLIVDTSASMLESWDHDGDPNTAEVTRWHSVRGMLDELVPELDDRYRLGLQLVPSEGMCMVEPTPDILVGEQHGFDILDALPDASSMALAGGSPLRAAYLSARDHLLAQPDRMPGIIIMITDGGANCTEPSLPEAAEVFDEELEAAVGAGYFDHYILTVVVGVDVGPDEPSPAAQPDSPAVDTFEALNDLALAGGYPQAIGSEPRKFFEVGQVDELQNVSPFAESYDCTIDLTMQEGGPPEPDQIPLVEIEIEGIEVPLVADCESGDGWTWLEEGTILTFCGAYCDKVKAGDAVEGTYGCP